MNVMLDTMQYFISDERYICNTKHVILTSWNAYFSFKHSPKNKQSFEVTTSEYYRYTNHLFTSLRPSNMNVPTRSTGPCCQCRGQSWCICRGIDRARIRFIMPELCGRAIYSARRIETCVCCIIHRCMESESSTTHAIYAVDQDHEDEKENQCIKKQSK